MISGTNQATPSGNRVWLVGAGPGDPELLTLKAIRLIESADIVLYDSLISPEILAYIPTSSRRVHVGKRCGAHKLTQEEINRLLYRCAKKYPRVIRLKGGDPFIFGRGGEEMDYLQQRGVAVSIVPGISAAIACAAAVNIPLTHRDWGNSLVLESGHRQQPPTSVHTQTPTRVFYMGLRQAAPIQTRLLAEGLPPQTPVALILNGSRPNQQLLRGRLDELPTLAGHAQSDDAGLIIVGDVTRFAKPDARLDEAVA